MANSSRLILSSWAWGATGVTHKLMLKCHSNFLLDYIGEEDAQNARVMRIKTLQFCIDNGRCPLNAVSRSVPFLVTERIFPDMMLAEKRK